MSADVSANDLFESLTGFDEIAIEKAFGEPLHTLRQRPFTFVRALVFIDQKRTGLKDPEAKQAALALPMRDLNDYFPAPEPAELDPDEPDTDAGKDASPTA